MNVLRSLLAVTCMSASFAAIAGPATYGDYAVVSCKTANLLVNAFSVSYDSSANPSSGCAATLKALANDQLQIVGVDTTADTVVYTLGYLNYSAQ